MTGKVSGAVGSLCPILLQQGTAMRIRRFTTCKGVSSYRTDRETRATLCFPGSAHAPSQHPGPQARIYHS